MPDGVEKALAKGGWFTVGTAALVGGVLGLIAWLRGDPPRRDLALFEIGGGVLLGAVSGAILWLLERGKTRPPA